MENLPWYVIVLIAAAGIVATFWLRVCARSSAIRRVWSELAARTGCTFNEADSSSSQQSVTGDYRGRPIRLDSDLDYSTTRISLKCSNPSGMVLSVIATRTLYPEEMYKPVVPRNTADLPVYSTFHAFTALKPVQDIKVNDAYIDSNFLVQSSHKPHVVIPLVEMLARFGDQSDLPLHREMLSFNIGQAGIGVVLDRLASRGEDIPRVQGWFNLVSEVADAVEKMT